MIVKAPPTTGKQKVITHLGKLLFWLIVFGSSFDESVSIKSFFRNPFENLKFSSSIITHKPAAVHNALRVLTFLMGNGMGDKKWEWLRKMTNHLMHCSSEF